MPNYSRSKSLPMIVGVLFLVETPSQAADYTITPPLTPLFSEATGINAVGQVVGYARVEVSPGNSPLRAFVYSGGSTTYLGTLGGDFSEAFAIDSSGRITGSATDSSGNRPAFLYANGSMSPLPTLGGNRGIGRAINNLGHVAGLGDNASGQTNAFVYANETLTNLGTLGGSVSGAFGMNDSGTVVGTSTITGSSVRHAFSFSGGTMTDLGTLGGVESFATAINSTGQIVGWAQNAAGQQRAFLRSNNTMTDLGTLGGLEAEAKAINDLGQVVGYSLNVSGQSRAFLYTNGIMFDLNDLIPADSGWVLERATGINFSGQIVGSGKYMFGSNTEVSKAFLMTLTPVPEPTTLLLVGGAAVGVMAIRRRRNVPPRSLQL
jgi:probable HAF family extracellular repeat protein